MKTKVRFMSNPNPSGCCQIQASPCCSNVDSEVLSANITFCCDESIRVYDKSLVWLSDENAYFTSFTACPGTTSEALITLKLWCNDTIGPTCLDWKMQVTLDGCGSSSNFPITTHAEENCVCDPLMLHFLFPGDFSVCCPAEETTDMEVIVTENG